MSLPSSTLALARMAIATSLALQAMGTVAQAAAAPKAAAPSAARPAAAAPSAAGLCSRVEIAPMVQIPVGKSTVLRPASPVTRILLGNPENARAARPAESGDAKKDESAKAVAAMKSTMAQRTALFQVSLG